MRLVVALVLAGPMLAASGAHAQMVGCFPGSPVDLGTLSGRTVEAVAATDGARDALVVVRSDPTSVRSVPLTNGTGGAAVAIAIDPNEHLVDLHRVRDVYVLRTVGVCPNAGRLFHKCMHLRVLAASGAQRGVTLDEDVVEWAGAAAAIVVGDRLVTLRTPMYDGGGVPSVATYRLSAAGDALAREGAVTRLGTDARPDAIAVLGARGEHWAALLISPVGDPPIAALLVADGGHATAVPRIPGTFQPTRAALEPDGTLAVLFAGGRVARIGPDGALREPIHTPSADVGLPPSLSADTPRVALRVQHGHVLVVDPEAGRTAPPLATLGPSPSHAPLLVAALGGPGVVVLFTPTGRKTTATAVPMRCGAVYQH